MIWKGEKESRKINIYLKKSENIIYHLFYVKNQVLQHLLAAWRDDVYILLHL